MKYFSLIDELFDFSYLMTEEVLQDLPAEMLSNVEDVITNTTITSELDPTMEAPIREDRNIKLYFNIIRRLSNNIHAAIENVKDISTFIDKVIEQNPKTDTLITNTLLANRLLDHPEFTSSKYTSDFISGCPYPVGTIKNIKIVVDPYMKYEDTNMTFFSKKDVRVAVYIKSANVEYQGLQSTKLVSTITTYLSNKVPVDKVEVKVPTEELI